MILKGFEILENSEYIIKEIFEYMQEVSYFNLILYISIDIFVYILKNYFNRLFNNRKNYNFFYKPWPETNAKVFYMNKILLLKFIFYYQILICQKIK